jgi:hypothetical protein
VFDDVGGGGPSRLIGELMRVQFNHRVVRLYSASGQRDVTWRVRGDGTGVALERPKAATGPRQRCARGLVAMGNGVATMHGDELAQAML